MIILIANEENDTQAYVTVVGEITEKIINQITNAAFPISHTTLTCPCGVKGDNDRDYTDNSGGVYQHRPRHCLTCGSPKAANRWWMYREEE